MYQKFHNAKKLAMMIGNEIVINIKKSLIENSFE